MVLSPALAAGDPDAVAPSPLTGLANATVKIESGFFAGDELFVNLPTTEAFSYAGWGYDEYLDPEQRGRHADPDGSRFVANYQGVLDAVSYRSTAPDPSNGGANPSRNISWVVNDGALNSQTPNQDPDNLINVTVLHFNAPPPLTSTRAVRAPGSPQPIPSATRRFRSSIPMS